MQVGAGRKVCSAGGDSRGVSESQGCECRAAPAAMERGVGAVLCGSVGGVVAAAERRSEKLDSGAGAVARERGCG